jgi:hypothetical protein
MTALTGREVVPISLADATGQLKLVPEELYAVAETFFG